MFEVRSGEAILRGEREGQGQPVTVFAHGLTNDRTELAAFTPMLPGTKVRFDFRGHGRSSSPATGYGYEDLAGDVDAVARRFDATVAVGTSLGAGALGRLVCRIPDRFERMVWLLPAGLDRAFAVGARARVLAQAVGASSPEALLSEVGDEPLAAVEHLDTPWRLQLERASRQHADPQGLANAIRGAVTDHPIPDRERLSAVTIPTLIVSIGADELHPAEIGRIMASSMPRAELMEFDDQGSLLTNLPEVVGRVASFIAGEA